MENKEAPIRLLSQLKKESGARGFEIRSLDNNANIYLALSSIIAFGARGIKDKLELPEPYQDDPSVLEHKERESRGFFKLPTNIKDRKDALSSNKGQPLRDFYGEKLLKNILSVYDADY